MSAEDKRPYESLAMEESLSTARTALILREGPNWERAWFNDVKAGDVFVLVEPGGKELATPCVATVGAEERPPPALGVIMAEELRGLTKDAVSSVYGPAAMAGVPHEVIVRGLLAMGGKPSQIDRLAAFILSELPGEPGSAGESEGAVDVAIRLMRELTRRRSEDWAKANYGGPCPRCGQQGDTPGGEYPCPECGRATSHDDEEEAAHA